MQLAPLLIAAVVCVAFANGGHAQSAPHRTAIEASAGRPYFVDFRARSGGVLGHTFVVYGRIDEHGRVLEQRYAGLYPHDNYSDSPLLPVLLVPGRVSSKKEDPHQPTVAVYRRRLNVAEYARLQAAVRRLRMTRPMWNFVFYNCNDFVADIAYGIGLRTPPGLQTPDDFVRGLSMMNR